MPENSEEAIDTVSSPADDSDFGANEWLVEEQYQLFAKDKSAVAPSWWPILERYAAQRASGDAATSMSAATTPPPAAPVSRWSMPSSPRSTRAGFSS